DLAQRRVVRSIAVGQGPGEARVSPDGKTVVVTERLANSVSVIDSEKLAVRSSIRTCEQPTDVEILPDSGKAFITCSGSGQVAVIGLNMSEPDVPTATSRQSGTPSPKSESSGKEFAVRKLDRLLSILDVGSTPVHLALKPDGGEVFVSNFSANTM